MGALSSICISGSDMALGRALARPPARRSSPTSKNEVFVRVTRVGVAYKTWPMADVVASGGIGSLRAPC
eukprot:5203954-Prymnesium_polylepis.1